MEGAQPRASDERTCLKGQAALLWPTEFASRRRSVSSLRHGTLTMRKGSLPVQLCPQDGGHEAHFGVGAWGVLPFTRLQKLCLNELCEFCWEVPVPHSTLAANLALLYPRLKLNHPASVSFWAPAHPRIGDMPPLLENFVRLLSFRQLGSKTADASNSRESHASLFGEIGRSKPVRPFHVTAVD